MKRTSESYITTVDFQSCRDIEALEIIRKSISMANASSNTKSRVRLALRGKTGYDRFGNLKGGIVSATHADIYIYKA
jgi:hypothetical protein